MTCHVKCRSVVNVTSDMQHMLYLLLERRLLGTRHQYGAGWWGQRCTDLRSRLVGVWREIPDRVPHPKVVGEFAQIKAPIQDALEAQVARLFSNHEFMGGLALDEVIPGLTAASEDDLLQKQNSGDAANHFCRDYQTHEQA